jgi:multidrug efflux pump subunit AcrA (membrane-fusion protein)
VQAERALADAKEQLAHAPKIDGSQVAVAQKAVTRSGEDLAEARTALRDLERRTGPMLPLSEVVFLPAFPARVESLAASVGSEVKAPLVTLSSGDLVVNAKLKQAQRGLLKPGMKVEITAELSGVSAAGSIKAIGELAKDETESFSYPMTVVAQKSLDAKLAGQDVRLTVEAASTDAEVLVVPLSAVFTSADGRTAVARRTADGRQVRVEVNVGTSGDGFASVSPTAGLLAAGDLVVIDGEYPDRASG